MIKSVAKDRVASKPPFLLHTLVSFEGRGKYIFLVTEVDDDTSFNGVCIHRDQEWGLEVGHADFNLNSSAFVTYEGKVILSNK